MDVVQLSKVGGLPDCCIVSLARLPHFPERDGSSSVEDVDASVGGGGSAAGGRVTSVPGMGKIPLCVCCAPSWRDAILLRLKSLEEGETGGAGGAAGGEEGMSPEGDSAQGKRGRGKCGLHKPLEDMTAVHFVNLQDNGVF